MDRAKGAEGAQAAKAVEAAEAVFAGKASFASTAPGDIYYLTRLDFTQGKTVLRLLAMSAREVKETERWILYLAADGALRIQSPPGGPNKTSLWIGFYKDLGWLTLVETFDDAAPIRLCGNPPGQIWEVNTPDGWKRVYYTAGGASPILTINGDDQTPNTFSPQQVTASLASIRAAKKATGANLRWVNLSGEDLGGLDFSGADFFQANLQGVKFDDATLADARFDQAVLNGIDCDRAVLDRAVRSAA